jgi:hypothetical protein
VSSVYTGYKDINGDVLYDGDQVKFANFSEGLPYTIKQKVFRQQMIDEHGKRRWGDNKVLWCMVIEERKEIQPIHYYINEIVKVN